MWSLQFVKYSKTEILHINCTNFHDPFDRVQWYGITFPPPFINQNNKKDKTKLRQAQL